MGAGGRGEVAYGRFVKKHPGAVRYVAVAEPNDTRRERIANRFGIPADRVFRDWKEMLTGPRLADAVMNAMPDFLHYPATLAALRAGYHVHVEKPMARTAGECIHLVRVAGKNRRVLDVGLEQRYARPWARTKELMDGGAIGRLMNMTYLDSISTWLYTWGWVRGNWRRSDEVRSLALTKAVHDLDIMAWYAGANAARVSSFGDLGFFKPDHAPPGAPRRCTDGCPVEASCPFNAVRIYAKRGVFHLYAPSHLLRAVSKDTLLDFLRHPSSRALAAFAMEDTRIESVMKALREGPHGRCVFRCDNDIVDRQVVNLEYENGVVGSLTMTAFSQPWDQEWSCHGTAGEIRTGNLTGRVETRTFGPATWSKPFRVKRERIPFRPLTHQGGDELALLEFARAVREEDQNVLTAARNTLEGHLLCFAAEEARLSGRVVDMKEFRQRAEQEAARLEN